MQAEPVFSPEGEPAEAPHLLVADDSPLQRSALASFLRSCGYGVGESPDGRSAVEHLKNNRVDLLLLDLNMPKGDGFEVLTYLQTHRRALPVILMSGMDINDIQRNMLKLKDQSLPPLLLKPIDPQQLLSIIELQLAGDLSDFH